MTLVGWPKELTAASRFPARGGLYCGYDPGATHNFYLEHIRIALNQRRKAVRQYLGIGESGEYGLPDIPATACQLSRYLLPANASQHVVNAADLLDWWREQIEKTGQYFVLCRKTFSADPAKPNYQALHSMDATARATRRMTGDSGCIGQDINLQDGHSSEVNPLPFGGKIDAADPLPNAPRGWLIGKIPVANVKTGVFANQGRPGQSDNVGSWREKLQDNSMLLCAQFFNEMMIYINLMQVIRVDIDLNAPPSLITMKYYSGVGQANGDPEEGATQELMAREAYTDAIQNLAEDTEHSWTDSPYSFVEITSREIQQGVIVADAVIRMSVPQDKAGNYKYVMELDDYGHVAQQVKVLTPVELEYPPEFDALQVWNDYIWNQTREVVVILKKITPSYRDTDYTFHPYTT